MKNSLIISFLIFTLFFGACKKAGTLIVNVQRQSVGQPIVVADSVVVLVKNIANSSKFYIQLSDDNGTAIFNEVDNADYEVSSEMWDGSNGLNDRDTIEIEKGKSATVNLLLQ